MAKTINRHLIAILRGVTNRQILPICEVLLTVGIRQIEVPLNSPDALVSIEQMIKEFGSEGIWGAGTVMSIDEVKQLSSINADLVVSPHCDEQLISQTKRLGMLSCAGVLSPTEHFNAINAGADILKLFPAAQLGVDYVRAMRSVLPKDCLIYAVGGINPEDFKNWLQAGVNGFGLGSSLYQPNSTLSDIKQAANKAVNYYDAFSCQ